MSTTQQHSNQNRVSPDLPAIEFNAAAQTLGQSVAHNLTLANLGRYRASAMTLVGAKALLTEPKTIPFRAGFTLERRTSLLDRPLSGKWRSVAAVVIEGERLPSALSASRREFVVEAQIFKTPGDNDIMGVAETWVDAPGTIDLHAASDLLTARLSDRLRSGELPSLTAGRPLLQKVCGLLRRVTGRGRPSTNALA